MPKILRNPRDSEIAVAIDQNMVDYWKSPREYYNNFAEFIETKEYFQYTTGISFPMSNGVLDAKLSPETAEETIKELIAFYEKKQLPFLWLYGPSNKPANLRELLTKNGLQLFRPNTGMAFSLKNQALEPKSIPKVEIVKVGAGKILGDFCKVALFGTGIPLELTYEHYLPLFSSWLLKENSNVSGFLAYLNGQPVASSVVFYSAGVAGIYWVATLEEARNKGIGTAITLAPMQEAKDLGYEIVILQSSVMGFNLYKRIGFKEYNTFQLLVWIK